MMPIAYVCVWAMLSSHDTHQHNTVEACSMMRGNRERERSTFMMEWNCFVLAAASGRMRMQFRQNRRKLVCRQIIGRVCHTL